MGAIASRGLELPESHCPCDVSMTIPVEPEGSWSSGEPVPRPVDLIALRAEVDVRAAILCVGRICIRFTRIGWTRGGHRQRYEREEH